MSLSMFAFVYAERVTYIAMIFFNHFTQMRLNVEVYVEYIVDDELHIYRQTSNISRIM